MEKLIIGLLRLLCPYFKAMAAKTETPIDDIVVRLLYMIAGLDYETGQ